jgi:hypothetical protein
MAATFFGVEVGARNGQPISWRAKSNSGMARLASKSVAATVAAPPPDGRPLGTIG